MIQNFQINLNFKTKILKNLKIFKQKINEILNLLKNIEQNRVSKKVEKL